MFDKAIMDHKDRIFAAAENAEFSLESAVVSVISETGTGSVAVWSLKPGQSVPAHTHPDGQDTWILLQGELEYETGKDTARRIKQGYVAVAEPGAVHGALNTGHCDAIFISVYSAPKLRAEPIEN